MMTKISNLIVLLKAASFLAWVDAEAINKVNARAGPCPDYPNQIGYKTIADLNLDQKDEADRIFEGDPPRTPYVFSLCSPYTYSVDNVDQEALNVMLDNSIFTCGNEGNNNNNNINEGQCVLEGAGHQVVVPPRMTVTFQGITFADFTGSSTEAGADAKLIFNDVIWTGLEDTSVLVAHDSPITVEINRGRVIGNNGVDGILTVDGHGVEADVLVKSSVGTGSTSENADNNAEVRSNAILNRVDGLSLKPKHLIFPPVVYTYDDIAQSTRRMHVTSEHALSKLGISIFGAVTGRGKTPARVSRYLQSHTVVDPTTLNNPNSPQSRAASWIAQDAFSADLQTSDPKYAQRFALATFYFATNGDHWEQCGRESSTCATAAWLSDVDECTWYSVGCTQQGDVFEIRFPPDGNNLVGHFPAELSLLTGMKRIMASSNAIGGSLDAPLTGLSLLEILYLPANQFRGSIPDSLYSLTRLNTLSLADNAFTGTISPDIGQLTRLAKLNLGKASLSGTIPLSIVTLDASLTDLLINDNQLTGPVPAAFGQLTNLEKLQIQGNQLTGSIPSALCAQQLGTLIVDCEVQCTCCENCGSAAVAASLASSVLSLGDSSTLASYLRALPVTAPSVFDDPFSPQSLAVSWIAHDSFSTGLRLSDPRLLQRYALATFYFATGGDNWEQCGRESPSCSTNPWLTDADSCTWYSLGCTQQGNVFEVRFPPNGNRLIGSLPAELSLLTGLKRLLASSNGIGGTLDAPLAGLSLLEILYLPSNQLSGSIPDSLYSLTSLNHLTLAENALTGTISPDIEQLVSLKDLFLNNNQFKGPLPGALGQLPSLEKLRIEGNQLSGSIPAAVCAQQLVTLVVDCEVQCTCCDNCGDAAVAAIDGSTGGLESFVAYLKTLPFTLSSAFDDSSSPQSRAASWAIEEDGLSASLPVRDPKLLQRYALAAFYFATGGDSWSQCGRNSAGCATSNPWLTAADECTWFSLGCSNDGVLVEIRFPSDGNRLIGPVPPDVSLLSGLKRFSAPTNAMSGSLDAFSGLSNLQTLYVSLNRFRGSIPASVYSLTSLDTLSLEQNALTGSISTLIGRLTDVSVLELGSSSLAGPIPDVSRLMHLSELNLEKTSLSGTIPESIGSLHASLTDVFLNDNRLTGPVPAAFGS
ncbi:Leucine rich repeat N-terminal domain [Seminavis robusta]|uniref:Leucine rich repeat N-terminal domain n=1 Tax=Seminavis robusta TaxID=568900 RepID=A0A9N8H8N7_9STRA|nr:Leucine rich repeat N-terminal domain [Seminavis robusta]|eukprot:Sro224_g091620.1 Leucine rich repeat N-terminal domain (1151) ;mRNA; f:33331-37329